MKKSFLCICCLAFLAFKANGQQQEEVGEPLERKNITAVYNHYIQDGNNSAVTGGINTEELVVYGPSISLGYTKNQHTFSLSGGVDIISSASTDNIDFIPSSASRLDARTYGSAGYSISIAKPKIALQTGFYLSSESDYLSLSGSIGIKKTSKDDLRSFSMNIQAYFDDLRHWRTNALTYAAELRQIDWFKVYHRNSYNLKLGLTQIINKRNIIGIFPEFTYQNGLLSMPFHRVIFDNDDIKPEDLPRTRYKFSLGTRLNTFIAGNFILKNSMNLYTDDFGINAIALENETVIHVGTKIDLIPNIRWYMQSGSKYFAPYKQHKIENYYYTSDYDLSSFNSYTLGLGLRYRPAALGPLFSKRATGLFISSILINYHYSRRSNNLFSHAISFVVEIDQ